MPEECSSTLQTPGATTETATTSSSSVVLEAELYIVKGELERKERLLKQVQCKFTYSQICEKDKLILKYTGLPNRNIIESLDKLVANINTHYYLKWTVQKLSQTNQILMTLMKLRQNLSHVDLAFRFQVSEATVTNVVVTFIHVLYEILYKKLMHKIPSRNKNQSCLPNCCTTFTNCRIIWTVQKYFLQSLDTVQR